MTQRLLSTAPLTLSHLGPVDFMRTAARAGFRHATVRTLGGGPLAQPEAMTSLIRTHQEVREVKAAMAEEGISAHEIEVASVDAGVHIPDFQRGLDWAAELGGRYLVTVTSDTDKARRLDNITALAALAEPMGIRLVVEFIPWYPIATLAEGVELATGVGHGMGVLVDALHLFRSGAVAADLAGLDPDLFPYVQLCDAPGGVFDVEEMRRQSLEERLDPGAGELDLVGVLRALPKGIPVNVEVPHVTRVAKIGSVAHALSVREHTERLLAAADA